MAARSRATPLSDPTPIKNSDLLAKSDMGFRRRVQAPEREDLGQQYGEIPGPAQDLEKGVTPVDLKQVLDTIQVVQRQNEHLQAQVEYQN